MLQRDDPFSAINEPDVGIQDKVDRDMFFPLHSSQQQTPLSLVNRNTW